MSLPAPPGQPDCCHRHDCHAHDPLGPALAWFAVALPRAEAATNAADLIELESFFIDLLALGKRLDWTHLTAFTARTDTTDTLTEFAQLARLAPDDLSYVSTAALSADSASEVAAYLITDGTPGLAEPRLALAAGHGAARQLLARQLPVNRDAGPA